MKQLLFASFLLLTIASCKKSWVCTCTGTCTASGDQAGFCINNQVLTTNVPIDNATRVDANTQCDEVYCQTYNNLEDSGFYRDVNNEVH